MKSAVEQAIDEIRRVEAKPLLIREDGEGGAYVILEQIDPGEPYVQTSTWIGFRISFQYPHADVYPHYVRGDLSRKDGRPLGAGTSITTFEGRPAVQLSRRSNNMDPLTDTALLKLHKVLHWLRTHP